MNYKLKLEEKYDIGIDFSQVKNITHEEGEKTIVYEIIHDGTDGFNECVVNKVEIQKNIKKIKGELKWKNLKNILLNIKVKNMK